MFPFIGALIAVIVYLSHHAIEAADRKEKGLEPSELQKARDEDSMIEENQAGIRNME